MAVNAKFVADFTSFYKEIQKTSPYLKNLGDETDKVARKFDTMTKGFSGDKIIREAHLMVGALVQSGQVANLTEKELLKLGRTVDDASDKMRRMGLDIPPGFKHISDEVDVLKKKMADQAESAKSLGGKYGDLLGTVTKLAGAFGLAFGAQAIVSGIKSQISAAVEYGSALKNMSTATGVSIAGLQRMAAVGADANVSMETLGSAVNVLQKQLDEPAAQAALVRMGLNFADIKRLAPEQQFFEIAKAVGSISDPIVKANTGADLFKGKWAEIAPSITGDMQTIIDKTRLLTDEQVQALERAGNRWDKMVRDTKNRIAEFIADLTLAYEHAKTHNPFDVIGLAVGATKSHFDTSVLPTVKGPGGLIGAGPIDPYLGPSASKESAAVERLAEAKRATDAFKKSEDEASAALIKFANSVSLYTLTSRNFSGMSQGPGDLLNFVPGARRFGPNTGSGGFLGIGTGPVSVRSSISGGLDRGSLFGGLAGGAAQSIVAALQGGGSVSQSVAGTIGSQLGSNVVAKFGASITSSLGKTFGGAINAVLPGLGALAAPLIGLVGKLLGKSEETSKVSPVRDEFFKLQGGLETLNPKIQALTGNLSQVDAIFKAKTVDQYNAAMKTLQETLAFQDKAMSTLTETAQRYGFTLEELGPALQRQNLDKQAQQLYQDFQVLNTGGLEHIAILDKMSDSINAYVNQALKLGVEVPEAMRPMLEDLAKNGKLLDENGNQITDLEKAGISFALTMSEGFKALIKSVEQLTRAIAVGLGVAIENIPDPEITGRIHWDVDNVPKADGFTTDNFAATGGMVTANGIQHFARGGRVLPWRRGSDSVPAMLTPGEMVLTAAQQRSLLANQSGVSRDELHIYIDGQAVEATVTKRQNSKYQLGRKVRAA